MAKEKLTKKRIDNRKDLPGDELFDPEVMRQEAEELIRAGKMPTFEQVLDAIREVHEELSRERAQRPQAKGARKSKSRRSNMEPTTSSSCDQTASSRSESETEPPQKQEPVEDEPTRTPRWTEEDIKAREGWTIHFGPMLRPTTQQAEAEPQPKTNRKRGGDR